MHFIPPGIKCGIAEGSLAIILYGDNINLCMRMANTKRQAMGEKWDL